MGRTSKTFFQRRMMIAMAVYAAVVMLTLPAARSSTEWPTKALLALAPVLPLLYVIWLMVERIRKGDELEQRTHLVGLGVATAVASIFSLIAGFLAAANVLPPEDSASALVWVFPLVMIGYGVGQWWVARRYGMDGFCDEEGESFPWHRRLLFAAALVVAIAAWAHWRANDTFAIGFSAGAGAGLVFAGAIVAARHWRRRHRADE